MKIVLLCLTLLFCQINAKFLVENVPDLEKFKKLCKSRKNILIFFNNVDSGNEQRDEFLTVLAEAAALVEGQATIAAVDCLSREGKKLCKTLKGLPEYDQPFRMKHYKGCDFNREYERDFKAKTIHRFLLNPDGETPWADEPGAQDVVHFERTDDFIKHIKGSEKPTLAIFYAPWCVHCKTLKPDFSGAAAELRNKVIFAAIDMSIEGNKPLNQHFKIPGFPTLFYFEKDKEVQYSGERTKSGILKWLGVTNKAVEKSWEESTSDVIHLKDDTFDEFINKSPSVLVMFYAPWCGYCRSTKPAYEKAAAKLKSKNAKGVLAAIDTTVHQEVKKQQQINAYPTFKYFENGKFMWYMSLQKEEDFVKFMLKPQMPESLRIWVAKDSKVVHLTTDNVEEKLKEYEHALVFYHTPDCPQCEPSKVEFVKAAKALVTEKDVLLAGMDCFAEEEMCKKHRAEIYPTILYFKNGKRADQYTEQASMDNFILYIRSKKESITKEEQEVDKDVNAIPLVYTKEVTVATPENFFKAVSKGRQVVMFCVSWSKKCQKILPMFNDVATVVKSGSLIAFDCQNQETYCLEKDASRYPTFQIYEDGTLVDTFEPKEIDDFMSALTGQPKRPKIIFDEAVIVGTHWNIENLLSSPKRSLVLFYAPWCGHCKAIKPEFNKAAKEVKDGRFIAVDCTQFHVACEKYDIKAYPSLRIFEAGKLVSNFKGERTAKGFAKVFDPNASSGDDDEFLFSPRVIIANEPSFKRVVEHGDSLVLFYAPWCGYCKKAKPEYSKAADIHKDGKYVAIDCTVNQNLCKLYEIRSYPSFKLFKKGKMIRAYKGGRTAEEFTEALKGLSKEENAKEPKHTEL